MAKEWYLLKKPYGKYDDGDNVMDEAFNSNLGADVEICNYDLSIRKPARVILGSRTQDTELKTRVHYILCKIGTCITGNYVYYDGRYWLVTGLVDNNGLYEKAVIEICEWLLTWQSKDRKIVQRWASAGNATQYNNGETSDGKLLYRSDQLKLALPDDPAVLTMKHNQRFVMDKRTSYYEKQFGDSPVTCTTLPVLTYKMTRIDSVSTNYGNCGTVDVMVTQDAQLKDDGFYVVDGVGYWLAFSPDDILDTNYGDIQFDSDIVYIGIGSTTFSAPWLKNENGDIVNHQWIIPTDISDYLLIENSETAIAIACNDGAMASKEFKLMLEYGDGQEAQVTVFIEEFI